MALEGPSLLLEAVSKRRVAADRVFELSVGRLVVIPGEAIALTGPSGCGKSTLIDLLALALRPDRGRRFLVALPGETAQDALALWENGAEETLARLRARACGYVLQTGGLLPFLSVFDNVALPLRLLSRLDGERVRELTESLGLGQYLKAKPHQLSVGQRQRVAIARALVHRPPIVLADEPTASLDPENASVVMELLLAAVRRQGSALVLATHDREMVRRFGIPAIACQIAGEGSTTRSVFAPQREGAAA